MFGNHEGFYLKPLGIGNHEWCFETYMIWSMYTYIYIDTINYHCYECMHTYINWLQPGVAQGSQLPPPLRFFGWYFPRKPISDMIFAKIPASGTSVSKMKWPIWWYLKDEWKQAARSFQKYHISPQVSQHWTITSESIHNTMMSCELVASCIKSYEPVLKEVIFCRTEIWYTIRNTVANLCTLTIHIWNTTCNQHFWWGSDVWSQRFPGTSSQKAEKASGMSNEMIVHPITSSSQPVLDITTCTNHLNCSASN